jgi:hypothetical protein
LLKIKKKLGIGNIQVSEKNFQARWSVEKKSHILDTIIPIFQKYPLQTAKRVDFKYFFETANLSGDSGKIYQESLK